MPFDPPFEPPSCPFCERLRRGDVWGTSDLRVVCFEPLNPVTPGHRLFVPIEHVESAVAGPGFAASTVGAAAEWARSQDFDCNLITSCGPAATQTVPHLHVHVVPRHAGDGLPLPWTPQQTGGEGIDWLNVVDRASAVAVGAGAPDDGATLPEQVEWLAARLHGPSLRAPDGPDLPLEIPDDARPGDLVRWTVIAGRVESTVVERRIQEPPFGRPFGQ